MIATATIDELMDSPVVDMRETRVRLEASLSSYLTALAWVRCLPATEVERRLAAKVDAIETAMRDEDQGQHAAKLRRVATRIGVTARDLPETGA